MTGFKWSPSRYEAALPVAPRRDVNGEDKAAAAAAAACEPWCDWRWLDWEDKTLFACWTKIAVLQVWVLIVHLPLLVIASSDCLPERNIGVHKRTLKKGSNKLFILFSELYLKFINNVWT